MKKKCSCGKTYEAKDVKELNICPDCVRYLQEQNKKLNTWAFGKKG